MMLAILKNTGCLLVCSYIHVIFTYFYTIKSSSSIFFWDFSFKNQILIGVVDTIFSDVAQPDQARIVAINAHHFLKNGGHAVISIKVFCFFFLLNLLINYDSPASRNKLLNNFI